MNPAFRCPSCGFRFRVEEKFLCRKVRCPNAECQQAIVLSPELADRSETSKPKVASSAATSAGPTIAATPLTPTNQPTRSKTPAAPKATANADSSRSVKERAPEPSKPLDRPGDENVPPTRRRTRPTLPTQRSSRYQSQSKVSPLIIGFVATVLLGGVVLGGYWFVSQPGAGSTRAEVTALASSETSSPANQPSDVAELTGSGEGDAAVSQNKQQRNEQTLDLARQQPGSAVAAQTSALAAPQMTAALTSTAINKNAGRQQKVQDTLIPFLTKHCSDCHNADTQEGGIAVHDLVSVDQLLKDRKKWERVYRMINAGAMPPQEYDPKPEEVNRKEVVNVLHDELHNFDCTRIHHAGRSTLHRLNRAEYNNTIRDLFGLSISPADKFPQDDVGEGFDNIGDVLSIPPLLMEKYLDAAEEVASAVIDTRDFSKGATHRADANQFTSSFGGATAGGDGFFTLASQGSVTATIELPADGKYRIRIEASADQAGPDNAKMGLQIDGKDAERFEIKGRKRTPDWYEENVKLPAGKHSFSVFFLNDFYDEKAPERRRDRNLHVRAIEVVGPEGGAKPDWHETHRRFVTARPAAGVSVREAASIVLRPILYRSFRRPVTDAEVARFASLVETTVSQYKETYDYGLFVALQAILVSPDFLFRKEADPSGSAEERTLNEYELASRLSYFLWSSMPDDELLKVAESKRLLDRTVLRSQIERMLKSDKAASLGKNFASQWLNLRNLADIRPNSEVFPDFDESLRSAMSHETELLFSNVVREDRSIDDFLNCDYTFVNERLAKHYGISGITGDEFIKVSLKGSNRSGVLTHASVLTLTSNPGRTSPVKRGKWILENILGESPPPPPPGVPPLEESETNVAGLSLRERLEIHRKDAGCASCHKTMDPLGMGLENFDAIGRWRDKEGDKPVDASGDLPSGEKFSGPIELISIIKGRQEQFYRTFAERLMVYALGRGLEYYDKCAVDQTLALAKQRGNRFSALVEGIVTSDPFTKRSRTREYEIPATP